MDYKILFGLIFLIVLLETSNGIKWGGDCSNAPISNDDCCKEDFYDSDPAIAKSCGQKYGIPLNAENNINVDNITKELTFEDLACFYDCLFTGEKNLNNGVFDMEKIKTDIKKMAKSETQLADRMIAAYDVCTKTAAKRMEGVKKLPNGEKLLKGKCPILALIVTNCAEMEYLATCPPALYNPSPDCAEVKAYTTKCKDLLIK